MLLQARTLARYGAPIAIAAGALMIITRLVILFTTPAEIGPFKAYLLTTTHAVNSVVSILAFALLVIALVALYDREARSAGAFGALPFRAAVIGTMFVTGDWWWVLLLGLVELVPDLGDHTDSGHDDRHGRHHLLIRRNDASGELAYLRCQPPHFAALRSWAW